MGDRQSGIIPKLQKKSKVPSALTLVASDKKFEDSHFSCHGNETYAYIFQLYEKKIQRGLSRENIFAKFDQN